MSKNRKYLNTVIFIVAISFLAFNDLGIIKLISIYSERKIIENEIKDLIAKEDSLINEINLLEVNDEYKKKIAREEFYMAKPGEEIYRVKSNLKDKVFE